MPLDSSESGGTDTKPESPLSPEVQLAWTLMGAEERIKLVKIATLFTEDPKDEEGEEPI